MTADFSRPLTAQEAVLGELRRMIADGRLLPGGRIVQDLLSAELGVSRVPLREALKILEGEGLVHYAAHRGHVVAPLSLADLLEVYRIRELLEPEAVTLAVPVLTEAALALLVDAAHEVEEAASCGDVTRMTVANRLLHDTLIEACGLPRLVRTIRQLWDATEVYRTVYYNDELNRERVLHEHRDLVEAACARDTEGLLAVLASHRANAITALRPVLSRVDATG
ncbi:GntR family transcriptional regulator [soil metagenome]